MSITKDDEIAFRGYEEVKEWFIPNDSLVDTMERLINLDVANYDYAVHKMSKKEALIDSRIFYKEKFKVHKVYFYNIYNILGKRFAYVRKLDPLKLPIKLAHYDGDIFEGSVIEHLIPNLAPVAAFRGIMLVYPFTEHTPTSYVHELMHTQIDSVEGSISNYFNAEVMSVFIELIFTYYLNDERLLKLEDNRRIHEMSLTLDCLMAYLEDKKNNLVKDDDLIENNPSVDRVESAYKGSKPNLVHSVRTEILEDSKYLISDLKAFNLFSIFYYSKDSIKKEMLYDIQMIMNGQISVEDYLIKYGITEESMQEEKRLMKYFKR